MMMVCAQVIGNDACITWSGEASSANGSTYTLYSIAAVVLGGVSLFGGSGSAVGAVFGALMFRTIGDLLFVFNLEPLWQPLFQGVVLFAAICLGALHVVTSPVRTITDEGSETELAELCAMTCHEATRLLDWGA